MVSFVKMVMSCRRNIDFWRLAGGLLGAFRRQKCRLGVEIILFLGGSSGGSSDRDIQPGPGPRLELTSQEDVQCNAFHDVLQP